MDCGVTRNVWTVYGVFSVFLVGLDIKNVSFECSYKL